MGNYGEQKDEYDAQKMSWKMRNTDLKSLFLP